MIRLPPWLLHSLQVLLILLAVYTGYLGYRKTRENTSRIMADLKGRVIVSLEETLGYNISYDQISPSLLTFLEIRNLKLTHPQTGEALLHIRNLKLFYNPLNYLFNRDDAGLISHINVNGLILSYSEQRDRELLSLFSSSGSQGGSLDLSRFFSGRVRIRSWSLVFKDENQNISFDGNTITLKQQSDYIRVKLAGNLSLVNRDDALPLDSLDLFVGVSGSLSNDLKGFNLNGDFRDVSSNLFDVSRQGLNIRYRENELKITKIRDNQPYDLSLVLNNYQIVADFSAERFSPDRILSLKNPLAYLDPWLSTVLSGTGHFEMDRESSALRYNYDGSAYLRNENLPFPVNALIDINGDETVLRAEDLTLSTAYGSVSYAGEWAFRDGYPRGTLGFEHIPVSGDITIEGTLALSEVDEYFYILSESVVLSSGIRPGSLKVLISRDDESFIFSLRSDLNSRNSYKDQILLNGTFSLKEGFRMQSSYIVNQLSPASIAPFLPRYASLLENESLASLLVESEGRITLDKGELNFNLTSLRAENAEGSRNFECSGFLTSREIEIYSLELNWDQNYILGSLQGTRSGNSLSLNTSWNVNNHAYLLNGVYSGGRISFIGNYGLKGQIFREPGSGFMATMEAEDYPFNWNGQEFLSSLNLRGRYRSRDWELYLKDTNIRWVNAELLDNPALTMTAYVAPGVFNIFSLQYGDDYSLLRGSGSLFYDLNQNVLNGSVDLRGSESEALSETYSVYCVYNDGNISSTLQFQNALLDRYVTLDMTGTLNAEMTMEGSLDSPEVSGVIETDNLVHKNNQLDLDGRFQLDSEKIELYDLTLQRNNVTLNRGLGFLNFQDGSMMLTTRYSNDGRIKDSKKQKALIESGLTLMIDSGAPVKLNELSTLKARDFQGRLRLHPVKWNDLTTYPSRTIEFSRRGSILSGELASDKDQSFYYDFEKGDAELYAGESFPVSFSLKGNIQPEELDISIDNMKVDLNLINYFMPRDKALDSRYVVFRENSAMEGRLHIGGTSKVPDITGVLQSRDLLVLTPYTVASIGETNLRINFLGDRIETNSFIIPIGKGQLEGQGYLNLNGWSIGDYSLSVKAQGDPGTPFTYNAFGLYGRGAFTGNVRLYGTNRQGGLKGVLVFNELTGSMGSKTVREKKVKNPTSYPFLLDLEFITGRSVLFLLPNPQLEIVRATAEQGASIKLDLDTRNGTMTMTGGVNIRNGEINYFDRTFRMTEGSITFNENEDSFNPFLNLEAEITTTDVDGDGITVYLSYRNPILDEFSPYLRTDPAMSEDQIMALFGQSLIPYDSDEVDLTSLVAATGSMVSDYGFAEPFESALKDSLNMDSVTIKTEILENALLDQLSGYETYGGTESSYNLGRYLDNTSIYLGRFLGDYLFFSAGLLVDYDELSGVGSYTGGMSLVPDLTLEMRTPFFLVAWNYNPENASDNIEENFFVPRNAISLEWRFSY